jgi:hypothetical protein
MRHKTPEKWLDRSTTAKIVEQEEDASLAIEARKAEQQRLLPPGVSEDLALKSLSILVVQGLSLDDAARKGAFLVPDTKSEEIDNDDDDDFDPYARTNNPLLLRDSRGLIDRNDISDSSGTVDGTVTHSTEEPDDRIEDPSQDELEIDDGEI